MLFISFIKDLITVNKIAKGTIAFQEVYFDYATQQRLFSALKDKSATLRNLAAKGLKKHRRFCFDHERVVNIERYLQYISNTHRFFTYKQIRVGDWVTIYTNEFPVPGKRYNEWFFEWHMCSQGETYMVASVNRSMNGHVTLYSYYRVEIDYRLIRPATDIEIEKAIMFFKTCRNDKIINCNTQCNNQIKDIIQEFNWLK